MKSSFNQSWDLRGGKTVQSWKPEEIFPSLTSEDMDSVAEEMLRLFHPEQADAITEEGQASAPVTTKPGRNQPVVSKWKLETLENVPASDFGSTGRIPGIEGTPVRIAQDEKQRLIAEARRSADETILNAKKSAREIVQAAQKEAEDIRQKAYETGRSQAITELQKTSETAQMIVDQVGVWREETIQQSEPLLIDMVQKIGRMVFGNGLRLENEVLQQNLDRVMKMAESLGDVRVYLNQSDVKSLDPEWRKFQESLSGKKIQIIPSDSIKPGSCYVQGERGVVDARVETQLNAVLSMLDPDHGDGRSDQA